MATETKRRVRPTNTGTFWRIPTFVLNEMDKDVRDRGFGSIPKLANIILMAYANDEVIQRPNVDINDIDLSVIGSTQTCWSIRSRSVAILREEAKHLGRQTSKLASNILLRYVLGQRIQRGK